MRKNTNKLKHKMKNVNIGRYNDPKLSFSVIASAIFWFFVSFIIASYSSYWHAIYLRSYIWKYRRKKRLLKDNFMCTVCGQTLGPMDIHHLTYDRVCRENHDDIVTVCRYHHMRAHNR